MTFIRDLYQFIAPETLKDRVVIFKTIDSSARPVSVTNAIKVHSFETLAQNLKAPCTIQILDNGQLLLWIGGKHEPATLAMASVVYTYEDRIEKFYARNEVAVVDKVIRECASNFSISTFDDLREALDSYRTSMIRQSSCLIFRGVWFDPDRIFFHSKPEKRIRQSLTQFLKIRLRGNIEVRPEQVVDETHPVDIKVTWFLEPSRTNRDQVAWTLA